ncbi:RidA family protein [Phreatobacter stygius]|uniref:RidA family protein n=1 Tax=Phreatobacter stygius TaxID=1940610 RepID=A0A4D7B0H8_9HYPH|nr:RidA family protein [Phreatobacter stygius]QCI67149.1 RidA family protein [Phreatobacter stygius]
MERNHIRGTWQEDFSFSPAVVTRGGRTVWLAGHTGQRADDGRSLAGDFEAQTRQTFRNLEKTLTEAGASLADLVSMTVFLIDARYSRPMTDLRKEILKRDFPASAAITVAGFANPDMMIEIQAVAVVPEA